ncbi:MAG TPA: hypothetical protein DEF85_06120 [Clostridiaceae bacterium]|nr:hypothetical protein [Clostridiaceae bacterium]HBF76770.1 hypothetical protein [Clostridiaceae bacterium]HBG37630.1 hypothetical protein [Clostridiaceae bacterium]HBN28214.1 hypothetical protein [Clostridiaceae bacterium]HBX48449.1 hypothetical protein [Clostridiaceae bacterium]
MNMMTYLNIFLLIFSPYLAVIPMVASGYKMISKVNMDYKNKWNWGMLFLFIWSFTVGVFNKNPVSASMSLIILVYFFLSIYLEYNYNDEEKIEGLLKKVIIISTFSAIVGVIERITEKSYNPNIFKYIFGMYPQFLVKGKCRISGTFGNPNIAGAWFSAMVIICLYFFQNSNKLKKIYYFSDMILFSVVLLWTGSRGALIGLAFGLIFYAYYKGHKKEIIFLAISFTMLFLLAFIFPEIFYKGRDLIGTIDGRVEIWKKCLSMFKDKPITGWGLAGTYYAKDFLYHGRRVYHGHNIWITIATTMGIVGLSVYVYMKWYVFNQISLLDSYGSRLTPLLAGLEAIIIGQGLVDFIICTPQGGMLLVISSACINGLANEYSNFEFDNSYLISDFKDR